MADRNATLLPHREQAALNQHHQAADPNKLHKKQNVPGFAVEQDTGCRKRGQTGHHLGHCHHREGEQMEAHP